MKSWSSTTTGDVQDSGWTSMSHPVTSHRRKLTKKRPWLLYGGHWLVWFTITFCNRAKPSQKSPIVRKLTKYIENCISSSRHSSTEEVRCCSTTTSIRTFHKSPLKSPLNEFSVEVLPHSPKETYHHHISISIYIKNKNKEKEQRFLLRINSKRA